MDLFDALEWSNWKNLSMELKVQVIGQVLMYFVSPLKRVSDVNYREFNLAGVKCGTFDFLIDGERFVFVPGNSEVILGWDLGIQGLPTSSWDYQAKENSDYLKMMTKSYGLKTAKDWDIFINESTSGLRKTAVSPMLIQKEALPAGTEYLGEFNLVTGEFHGLMEQYVAIEPRLKRKFEQPKSLEETLFCQPAPEIFEEEHFYARLDAQQDCYHIYSHQSCSLESLRKRVNSQVFDLLSEDEWEYAAGGGTRKLFRWGNQVLQNNAQNIQETNMFGLSFDRSCRRYELTDSNRLKLEKLTETQIPLFDRLPLASYYRSRRILSEDEPLHPCDFIYRKCIVIQP